MVAEFTTLVEPCPATGCWLWTGELNRNGYATYRVGGSRKMAHRELYAALVGPIPEGFVLDHLCRVRSCVAPHHQEPVTVRDNTLRGSAVLFGREGAV